MAGVQEGVPHGKGRNFKRRTCGKLYDVTLDSHVALLTVHYITSFVEFSNQKELINFRKQM